MIGMINSKYKTTMCRHFEQTGNCQLGTRCHFAHGKEELRKATDPIPTMNTGGIAEPKVNTMGQMTQMNQMQGGMPNYSSTGIATPSNYKTVKCKYFEKGYCKYNQSCSFAHGDEDIKLTSQSTPPQMQQMQYQQPTTPTYTTPLMDPTIQNSIAQQQIQYLISQMENYHANNQTLMVNIKNAQELNNANNTQAAASLLYEIIQRVDKSKDDADNYNTFLAAIQQLGTQLYQQLTIQFGSSQNGSTGYGGQGMNYMGYGGEMGGQNMNYGGMGGGYQGSPQMMGGGGGQMQMAGQYMNGPKGFSSK